MYKIYMGHIQYFQKYTPASWAQAFFFDDTFTFLINSG